MTAQQLKNSILQMAVQGKLVPQDPNDEPASVLLEHIRAEKERLIKEKKIKKEKNPSVIFRGADNIPYEKVGDKVRSLEDEVPFGIPDSWEWARLSMLGDIIGGGTPKTSDSACWTNGLIPWLTPADMKFVDGKYVKHGERNITEHGLHSSSAQLMPAGTIVYSSRAPIGYAAIAANELCTNQGFKSLVPIDTKLSDYLYYALIAFTPSIQARASGTTFKEISGSEFAKTLIPIPPLAEQTRIVSIVEHVLPFLEEYNMKEIQLSKYNAAFPDRLKKSILQMAVQGKLIPQDPADEPAEILLERIRKEKAHLVKEGKIKKDKHESIIFRRDNSHYEKQGAEENCIDDEIPFELPVGWCWCRFANICYKLTDGSHNPPPKKSKGFRVISAKNIKNGNIIFTDEDRLCDQQGFDKENPRTQISKGDVILGIIGGSIGNTAVYKHDEPVIAQRSIAIFGSLINSQYMKLLLDSPLFQQQFSSKSNGTAQGGIYLGELAKMLVPLPPHDEQLRILASISILENCLTSM